MGVSRLVVACLIAALAHPGVARAAPASLDIQAARVHAERGKAAFALEDYRLAASEYEQAFELHADSALLYNAAQSHRLAGNLPRSLTLFESYTRLFSPNAKQRRLAETYIAELRAEIAQSRPGGAGETAPVPQGQEPAPRSAANEVVDSPRPRRWVWGVVGGVAGVVVVGLALGLGLGLGLREHDPSPSYGAAELR